MTHGHGHRKSHSRKSLHYGGTSGQKRSTFAHIHGIPEAGFGTTGWRRVSTRQWIRDFREHISSYQLYPYKPICKVMFWSFGYYPDMVSKQMYQKYTDKYPLPEVRHGSGDSLGMEHGDEAAHYDEDAPPGAPPPLVMMTPEPGNEVPGVTPSEMQMLHGTESDHPPHAHGHKKKSRHESHSALPSDSADSAPHKKHHGRKSKVADSSDALGEDHHEKKHKGRKSRVADSSDVLGEDHHEKKHKGRKSKMVDSEDHPAGKHKGRKSKAHVTESEPTTTETSHTTTDVEEKHHGKHKGRKSKAHSRV